eukprot:8309108-Alexandrium_andersonii.AAC.1
MPSETHDLRTNDAVSSHAHNSAKGQGPSTVLTLGSEAARMQSRGGGRKHKLRTNDSVLSRGQAAGVKPLVTDAHFTHPRLRPS